MEFTVTQQISTKRLLLVDPKTSMRSVVTKYFRSIGFSNVESAKDGQDASKILAIKPVDMVISDWIMPNSNGLDLLAKIRQCHQTRQLPFLMMTAVSELGKVRQAVELGVSDYLIKPFQPAQLGFKVVTLLEQSDYQAKLLTNSPPPNDDDSFVSVIETMM